MKYLSTIPCAAILAFILYSCANIAPPSGGEKDLKKPRLVRTSPKNGTLSFKGKQVKYTFNEWIDENKLKDQLIITPHVENYETDIAKNILTIHFDSATLTPNTTYYLNLREGIKDITEGNFADSTTLVFSTGKFIDSLTISGKTSLLLQNKTEANTVVYLYEVSDTFSIEKSQPKYITKSNENGDFTFYNVKNSTYYLYAFKDDNKNGQYELNKEFIGYFPDKIYLTNSLSNIYVPLVAEDHQAPKLRFKEFKKKDISSLQYTEPLTDIRISEKLPTPLLTDNNIRLYTNAPSPDSILFHITVKDLAGNSNTDTIKGILPYVDTSRTNILSKNSTELEPTDALNFMVSKPFASTRNAIEIRTAGKLYKDQALKELVSYTEDKTKGSVLLQPLTPWTDTVHVTIKKEHFQLMNGYIKEDLKIKFGIKNPETYGSIGGTVETGHPHFIVQLTDKEGKVVKELYNEKNFLFQFLNDAEYRVRVVQDVNNNRKWDQGDYRTRKMPEFIHYYTEIIKLKSNWEILDLKISF